MGCVSDTQKFLDKYRSQFCRSLHIFGRRKQQIGLVDMCKIPQRAAYPFFLFPFHLLEQVVFGSDESEPEWHPVDNFGVLIFFNKMVAFSPFLVVSLNLKNKLH